MRLPLQIAARNFDLPETLREKHPQEGRELR